MAAHVALPLVVALGLVAAVACGNDGEADGTDAGGNGGRGGASDAGEGGTQTGGATSGGSSSGGSVGAGGGVAKGGSVARGGSAGDGGGQPAGGSSGAGDAGDGGEPGVAGAGDTGGQGTGGASSGGANAGGAGGPSVSCAPQDASAVGACEPAPFYAFNGVECVPMVGCDCVGEDCENTYRFDGMEDGLEACEAAHAACGDRARECQEIADTYLDYASHTACEGDSDCTIVFGHCGSGIGGCHYVLNRHWGMAGLDALAEAWTTAGCVSAVCACTAPPTSAVCLDGACAAGP